MTADSQFQQECSFEIPPTCGAFVFHGPQQGFKFEELSIPALADGEVLVRILCSTLCGSDLHTIRGARSQPTPSILGHEAVGCVARVAGQATTIQGQQLRVGQRVTWSICVSCGHCQRCLHGLPQKCQRLAKYGHQAAEGRLALSGGLAQYMVLRPETSIAIVPTGIPLAVASLANCAVSTIAAAYRATGSPQGLRVAIMGAGMLGLTAAAYANFNQAEQVTVMDVDPARLSWACEFGATQAVLVTKLSSDHNSMAQSTFESLDASRRFDLVLELSGAPGAVETAIEVADVGGKVALVGSVMPSPGIMLDPESVVRRCLSVFGIHNYAPQDLNAALHFLHSAHERYPFLRAAAPHFSLDQLPQAIRFAEDHRPLRVAIFPSEMNRHVSTAQP
ncbi:MAG: zinc-binding dehydrogenase [Pirellulaceae bacterium]|nr:zinc-binding dehydrogenase [Pirellulaceae bacterium]